MESEALKARRLEEERAQLEAQIAALMAKKAALDGEPAPATPPPRAASESGKLKRRDHGEVIAPASPSPKRRRLDLPTLPSAPVPVPTTVVSQNKGKRKAKEKQEDLPPKQPQKSTLLSKLAKLSGPDSAPSPTADEGRSTSFDAKPRLEEPTDTGVERDDRLKVVEKLERGPYNHAPPVDDPTFERIEPHSGTHLSSRTFPHSSLADYLADRYFVSPSMLYSVVRLQPNGTYEVPLVGDWVTIAVVAERGPVRVARALGGTRGDDDEDATNPKYGKPKKDKGKEKEKDSAETKGGEDEEETEERQEDKPKGGRRFVTLKLVDFGARDSAAGDAQLNLLLFEADSVMRQPRAGGGKDEMIYKGGSKGAYERMATLREGSVVALLNPRVLKPYSKNTSSTANVLALTPESLASTLVIGTARDLGRCTATRKDGKTCGAWFDKRKVPGPGGGACEWHVESKLQRVRGARAEFTVGTSNMSRTAKKVKTEYDPRRKWGLQPQGGSGSTGGRVDSDSGGATYVISGQVVSHSTSSLFVNEKLGREAQRKDARKEKEREEQELVKLMERDEEGMGMVEKARAWTAAQKEKEKNGGKSSRDKGKTKDVPGAGTSTGRAYTAETIKLLGFDPSASGVAGGDATGRAAMLSKLAATRESNGISLRRRPGTKHRSSVQIPGQVAPGDESIAGASEAVVDLDSSSDDGDVVQMRKPTANMAVRRTKAGSHVDREDVHRTGSGTIESMSDDQDKEMPSRLT
ncbi:unnamed protein product [Peniophora sp. CBMAI 1063]|nr:unnamed protein product [Peniophora sp. CBMAI 1063]